jgi:hypothetical protein
LVESKEHCYTGMETTPRDGVRKLITLSGLYLDKDGSF